MNQKASNWSDSLMHSARSDVGMRRANNQDSYTVVLAGDRQQWRLQGHLFLVADGMGAHAAGELASQIAAESVSLRYQKPSGLPPPEALRDAVAAANTEIHERGMANLEFQGMGTTCSALLLLPQGAVVAHVGDSRVYRLRKGRLEQLTFDHSLVWEMQAAGQLSDDDTSHLPKNIITRSLGPNPTVEVDLEGPFPVQAGDTFLLCSDGLTGHVEDEELGILMGCLLPEEATRVLIDLANLRGGADNITVIVAKALGNGLGPDGETMPLELGRSSQAANPMLLAGLWIAASVCALAAIGAGLAGKTIAAAVAGGVALASAVGGLILRQGSASDATTSIAPGQLGKGPHTVRDCPATSAFVASLTETVEELRQVAADENWAIEWDKFNTLLADGVEAVKADNNEEAVRQYARAVMFVMNALRNQPDAS